MKIAIITAAAGLVLLAGCKEPESPPRVDEEPQGREETRLIRNTEHIGYSGNAIADKVDGAITTVEQGAQRLQAAESAQTE